MLTLLLASAFAADPDDGIVAAGGPPVEMPAARTRGNTIDTGTWSRVPDALSVEVALAHHDISVEDAAVVTVNAYTNGKERKRVRLDWLDLDDGLAREMSDRSARRGCAPHSEGGIWSGAEEIKVYTATGDLPPGIVFVDRHPSVGALVGLSPGDSVTIRDVRHRGLLVREIVTVQRADASLEVRRGFRREQLCYEAG